MVRRGDMMSVDDVMDILAVSLLGAIPDDESIVISTNQGEPLVGTDTPSGRAYYDVCKRLLGEDIPMTVPDTGRGLISRLTGFLKRA